MTQTVNVIGAGLAGSEAAYQLAERGIKVNLIEMRPVKQTPAHHTDKFAELVCSNSLRGNALTNGVGVLKEEMRRLNSIIIEAADKARVPAGGALAVDRHDFQVILLKHLKIMKISQLLMKKLMPFQMDTQLSQQDHLLQKPLRKK